MRKLTFFISVLLLALCTERSKAQTPTDQPITDAVVQEGYYFIASTAEEAHGITNPYIAANGTGSMKLLPQGDMSTDISTSKTGIWLIQKIAGTSNPIKYSIKSVESSTSSSPIYWASGPDCPLRTSPGYYEIRQTGEGSDTYTLNGNGNGIGNTAPVNAASSTSFERSAEGTYNTWKLIPAGIQDVTINYTAHGTAVKSETHTEQVTGTQIALTTDDLGSWYSTEETSITVTAGQNVYDIALTASFPFELGTFYNLKIRAFGTTDGNTNLDNRYIAWNVANTNIDTRKPIADADDMGGYWWFEAVPHTTDQVYLYTHAKGRRLAVKFANMATDGSKAILAEAGTAFKVNTITPSANASSYTNAFRLTSPSNDNYNINDVNGQLGVWTDARSKTDQGSTFTVEKVSDYADTRPQPTEITTVNATDELGNSVTFDHPNYYWIHGTATENVDFAALFSPVASYYTVSSSSFDDDANPGTATISVNNNFPFAVSLPEEKKYTVLRTRNDATHYITASYSGTNSTAGTTLARDNSIDATSMNSIRSKSWAFVKKNGTVNQFYIYSYQTGDLQLTLPNENQGTQATMTQSGTPFYIEAQPSAFTDFTGGFTIRPNASNSHALGDHGSGPLTYWTNRGSSELNDDGSIYRVVDVLGDCKNIIAGTGYVGCFTEEAKTALNATATQSEFFAKYDELRGDAANMVHPEEGKYYRLYFNRSTQYVSNSGAFADAEGTVSEEDASRDLLTVAADGVESNVSTICTFAPTANAGEFQIKNPNSAFYWGSTKANRNEKLYTTKWAQYGGKYSIVYNALGSDFKQVLVKDNEITAEWCYLASRYEGSYGQQIDNMPFDRTDGVGLEPGIVVYIKEVTEHPVTFKAQYATLTLPFDVDIPAEGVNAYVAGGINTTESGITELVLTQLSDKIPSGTPVILECTAETTPTAEAPATYQLTLSNSATSYSDTNLLSGTTVRRQGLTAGTYYGLSLNAQGEAGFNISSIEAVPANKAYLTKASLEAAAGSGEQTAQYIRCIFDLGGGEVTEIDNAPIMRDCDADNAYYDLKGRRVVYPTRGIYVKGNGQKVFIK